MMGSSRVALRLEPERPHGPECHRRPARRHADRPWRLPANDIQIHDDGTAGGVTVTVDGLDQTLSGAAVSRVVVLAGSGDDTVSYALTGDYVGTTRTVNLYLGNGDDTFTGDLGFAIDADSSLTLRVCGGNGRTTCR